MSAGKSNAPLGTCVNERKAVDAFTMTRYHTCALTGGRCEKRGCPDFQREIGRGAALREIKIRRAVATTIGAADRAEREGKREREREGESNINTSNSSNAKEAGK